MYCRWLWVTMGDPTSQSHDVLKGNFTTALGFCVFVRGSDSGNMEPKLPPDTKSAFKPALPDLGIQWSTVTSYSTFVHIRYPFEFEQPVLVVGVTIRIIPYSVFPSWFIACKSHYITIKFLLDMYLRIHHSGHGINLARWSCFEEPRLPVATLRSNINIEAQEVDTIDSYRVTWLLISSPCDLFVITICPPFSSFSPCWLLWSSWWFMRVHHFASFLRVLFQQLWSLKTLFPDFKHGSLHVSRENHPTMRYLIYNCHSKVMSNSPKMGHLPIPVKGQALRKFVHFILFQYHSISLFFYTRTYI